MGGGGGGAGRFRFLCHSWEAMGLGVMQVARRTWEWSPTWSEIIGVGGLDPLAATRGAYAGLVHGIVSHPKLKTSIKPATGVPHEPHPPNPRDTFTKTLGAIRLTLVLALIWGSLLALI